MQASPTKRNARHTLFIDQADATYWLAAGSLFEEEDEHNQEEEDEHNQAGLGQPGLEESTEEGEKVPTDGNHRRTNYSRPISRQLPCLPLNVPDRSAPLCAPTPYRATRAISPFLSDHRAASSPLKDASSPRKAKFHTRPPNVPLPPIPGNSDSRLLKSAIKLQPKSYKATPSPTKQYEEPFSSQESSSLLSYLLDDLSSVCLGMPSTASSHSDIQFDTVPAFPQPPERAMDINTLSHSSHHTPHIKRLPQTPSKEEPRLPDSKSSSKESIPRGANELYDWSAGMSTAACPSPPAPSFAVHQSNCWSAGDDEVSTFDCLCRAESAPPLQPERRRNFADETDALESSTRQQPQTKLNEQRRDLQYRQMEASRANGEMRRDAAPTLLPGIDCRKSSLVGSQKAKSPSQRRSRHVRMTNPGEQLPAHIPSGSILLTSPPRLKSSLDLATSRLGEAVRMQPDQEPCLERQNNSVSSSQRSPPSQTSDSPGGPRSSPNRNRMMISTVRSHNRDALSPNRNGISPTLTATRVNNRNPIVLPGHHRQTSSKSSNYSSDSNMSGSAHSTSTFATSTESLNMTLCKPKSQVKGLPLMNSISEKVEDKGNVNSHSKEQLTQRMAYPAEGTSFPYRMRRQDG
ncbi:hypothetical protein CBS101457_004458 [Exobasidium rhododendri]|nr:hypothetical protein CBS101457_004458 [Exobasidium rhododendri]